MSKSFDRNSVRKEPISRPSSEAAINSRKTGREKKEEF
jgi:hypothetical protein